MDEKYAVQATNVIPGIPLQKFHMIYMFQNQLDFDQIDLRNDHKNFHPRSVMRSHEMHMWPQEFHTWSHVIFEHVMYICYQETRIFHAIFWESGEIFCLKERETIVTNWITIEASIVLHCMFFVLLFVEQLTARLISKARTKRNQKITKLCVTWANVMWINRKRQKDRKRLCRYIHKIKQKNMPEGTIMLTL